jgi:hypothetical protein
MIAEAGPSGFYIDWDPGIRYSYRRIRLGQFLWDFV